MSPAGQAFLKCAFASPDFGVDPGKGIPDRYQGRTLAIKDCYTASINFTAGQDTYIVASPIPGYAYFQSVVASGAQPVTFTGVPFPTYATNFGTNNATSNFSKFRYASLAMGLYPTSNLMQFGGSIAAWKVDLALAETATVPLTATEQYWSPRLSGAQGITVSPPRDNVTHSFIDGMFSCATDRSGDFDWHDFQRAPNYDAGATGTPFLQQQSGGAAPLTGLGNTNTIVYKISSATGAVNSAVLKIWNCVELQPNTNSSLFQFSGISPAHDPVAIEAYNHVKMMLPVAVKAAANASMWQSVLSALSTLFGAGSMVPGPLGVISGGLEKITSGISGLVFG